MVPLLTRSYFLYSLDDKESVSESYSHLITTTRRGRRHHHTWCVGTSGRLVVARGTPGALLLQCVCARSPGDAREVNSEVDGRPQILTLCPRHVTVFPFRAVYLISDH